MWAQYVKIFIKKINTMKYNIFIQSLKTGFFF